MKNKFLKYFFAIVMIIFIACVSYIIYDHINTEVINQREIPLKDAEKMINDVK